MMQIDSNVRFSKAKKKIVCAQEELACVQQRYVVFMEQNLWYNPRSKYRSGIQIELVYNEKIDNQQSAINNQTLKMLKCFKNLRAHFSFSFKGFFLIFRLQIFLVNFKVHHMIGEMIIDHSSADPERNKTSGT